MDEETKRDKSMAARILGVQYCDFRTISASPLRQPEL